MVNPLSKTHEGDVGRPLVGLLYGNEDCLLSRPGDPQGASLHFLQYTFKGKIVKSWEKN